MQVELAEYIQQKYDPPHVRELISAIKDPERRFNVFLDTLFSEVDINTVNSSVYYAFYYLSYRNPKVRKLFVHMFKKHRDWITRELEIFMQEGIIKDTDPELAADFIVSAFEGLSFHSDFLAGDKPFSLFGQYAKKLIKDFLKT